jgi:AcrR family transcriptional regulator
MSAAHGRAVQTDRAPSPREVRRLLKADVTRTQILDIAEQSFAESGYANANLRGIAARCEMSVGALYGFFAGKDELFLAVINRHGRRFQDLIEALVGEDLDPARKLIELAELQVTFFQLHPHWASIVTAFVTPGSRSTLPAGEGADSYDESYRRTMDVQAAIVLDGQRRGQIRAGDPQAIARIFSSMVSMFHVIEEQRDSVGFTFSLAEFLEMVAAALRPPAA